jgi:hypothetical protein
VAGMIKFVLEDDAGEQMELLADSRDVLKWEKSGPNRTFVTLMRDMSLEEMYRVAWITAKRKLEYGGSLAQFCEHYMLDFDPTGGQREPDPTQTGVTTAT